MFSKLFRWLKNLLSKIWKLIKKFWPIIAIALLIMWPGVGSVLSSWWTTATGWLSTGWGWIKTAFSAVSAFAGEHGWATTAALGLGALAVISPETAKDVVDNIVDVGGSIVDGAGELIGGALKTPLLWVGGGLLLFFLLSRDDDAQYNNS